MRATPQRAALGEESGRSHTHNTHQSTNLSEFSSYSVNGSLHRSMSRQLLHASQITSGNTKERQGSRKTASSANSRTLISLSKSRLLASRSIHGRLSTGLVFYPACSPKLGYLMLCGGVQPQDLADGLDKLQRRVPQRQMGTSKAGKDFTRLHCYSTGYQGLVDLLRNSEDTVADMNLLATSRT